MSGKGGKPRRNPGIKGIRPDRKAQKRAEAIARGAPIHPPKVPFIKESAQYAKQLSREESLIDDINLNPDY